MPIPNNYSLPAGVEVNRLPNGLISLSQGLVELLVEGRSSYDWPAGIGSRESQQTILALEASVASLKEALNEDNAHAIITQVSGWAGNNARSHNVILEAPLNARVTMLKALNLFDAPNGLTNAIDDLSDLPGIHLVIASKIFRFFCPGFGAAVDRHSSYFFNSLELVSSEGIRERACNFKREWANRQHNTSRLANFNQYSYAWNRREYLSVYLPLLASIANALNELPAPYHCAATGEQKNWRPTDVEMAAYYWGACNGAR